MLSVATVLSKADDCSYVKSMSLKIFTVMFNLLFFKYTSYVLRLVKCGLNSGKLIIKIKKGNNT